LLLLAAGPVLADEENGEVRVYTNEDLLLKYGPPPSEPAGQPVRDDAAWDFVAEFLEREYARLDADRAYDLEHRRVELEEEAVSRRDSYAVAGYPYLPYAYGYGDGYEDRHDYGYGHDRGKHGHHRGDHHAMRSPSPPSGFIVPLHARPLPGAAHLHRIQHRNAAASRASK
jgi:hypothetical protein